MKRCVHPLLGEFQAQVWEWRAQRELSFSWGFSTRRISIIESEGLGAPSDGQFRALVGLLEKPASFRDELSLAIFNAYRAEIRSEYLAILSDGYTYDFTAEDLPELGEAKNVWELVTRLYSVWVLEDASVTVEFSVTFDPEHELHVRLSDGTIARVWME